jgi:subtilisin
MMSTQTARSAVGFSLRCLFVLSVAFAFFTTAAAGQPSTPIDSDPDETDTEDDRVVPSEQVPFGIRTMYGDENLTTPSGGAGVTVAVVDSGVDTDHPDLRDRVTLCRDFTGDSVRDRCHDANGHGTHVAGTIAADGGDDDRGIYGVAPAAEIYAFKACTEDGSCGADPLASAIRNATDEGADVIVLSLGGRPEPRISAATTYATDRGVVLVAASGNSGPELGSILYPAAHPNVIAVGAVGSRDGDRVARDNYRTPEFSSRGVEEPFSNESDGSLEIAAPGVGVLSPLPGEDYGTKTGTSMAAPHVAGLTAKILGSASSELTVAQLRAELRERAPRYDISAGRHARAGYDPAAGFGIPTVSVPKAAFSVSPDPPVSEAAFTLDGTPSRSDAQITAYAWDTTNDGAFDRTGERIDIEKPPGTHRITLRVTDAENASATITEEVFVNDRPRLRIRAPESVTVGADVTFEAVVENEFGETEVTWTFSDGTTMSGERVTRSFDAGEQAVAATVVDEYGAVKTAITTVSVREPEPEPDPDTIDDQGPTVTPALVVALVIGTLLARRIR